VVDLRQGKTVDDGYRAVHLYYQRDNLAYPIEVQLWCGKDFYFNIWSHQYIYKYKAPEIGKSLYRSYAAGAIQNEQEFVARLREMEANNNVG
jgi:putative GTP pyrophosphokinase